MKQKHKTLIAQQKLNIRKKKNAKLSDKLKQTEKKVMDFDNIENEDKTWNFLTGISNVQLFKWLLSLIKPNVELASKLITYENQLLVVSMKLRHGTSAKTWHLDLIHMLPISQTFSELT